MIEALRTNEKQLVTGKLVSQVKDKISEIQQHEWLTYEWVVDYWKEEEVLFAQIFEGFTSLFKYPKGEMLGIPAKIDSNVTT